MAHYEEWLDEVESVGRRNEEFVKTARELAAMGEEKKGDGEEKEGKKKKKKKKRKVAPEVKVEAPTKDRWKDVVGDGNAKG